MQESMTMAEVGSIVKVSGSRIATPFGPPRPGSTPTKIPSSSPTIISDSVFQVSSTPKPCSRRVKASIARLSSSVLAAEEPLDGSLGHDDVEGDVERDEHREREHEGGDDALPRRDAPDEAHEARDQQEARDVEAEPLHQHAKQQRRHEDLQYAPELIAAQDERLRSACA